MTGNAISNAEQLIRRYMAGERDFRGVQLPGATLHSAVLAGAILDGASLAGADLIGADLTGIRLAHANLDGAEVIGGILTGADLMGSSLNGADLSAANLDGVDLSGAVLVKARLVGTSLRGARLVDVVAAETDMSAANLTHADLSYCSFDSVTLEGATLAEATLTGAGLVRARLAHAIFGGTILAGNDLSETAGLEQCEHWSPSHISTDTLRLSGGRVPIPFLRGAGLSELDVLMSRLNNRSQSDEERRALIDELRAIHTDQSLAYYSVFISYSTRDETFASKLYADLQRAGVRCWFAPHDMRSGRKLHEQIESAISSQDRLLLLLSPSSMSSNWVRIEIAKARAKEREQNRPVLFPISLVNFEELKKWRLLDTDTGEYIDEVVRAYHIPDFSKWTDSSTYRDRLDALIRDLKN